MKHKGVIYILTNPSFPDYVKLGYATNIEKRLKQLNRSETIPFAFRTYAVYETDGVLTDKELHALIDKLNPDLRAVETFDGRTRVKEFYAMSPEDAYAILESIAKISGTESCLKRLNPTGHEITDEETADEIRKEARRGPFRFSMVGINPGDTIAFVDEPAITTTVVDDRHIEYDGITTSLSAAAQQIKGFGHAVQGTLWWTYNNKTLDELRQDAEKDKET